MSAKPRKIPRDQAAAVSRTTRTRGPMIVELFTGRRPGPAPGEGGSKPAPPGRSRIEEGEVDRVRHLLIAGGVQMQLVAAVVRRGEVVGGVGVAHGGVEIDDRVEVTRHTNPGVHGVAPG